MLNGVLVIRDLGIGFTPIGEVARLSDFGRPNLIARAKPIQAGGDQPALPGISCASLSRWSKVKSPSL